MIAVQTLLTGAPGFRMTEQEVEIWCLSAHHLRRWFKDTLLFTDSRGEEAAKALGLPYYSIITGVFDVIPAGFRKYYALAKILTYRLMGVPFHHSDIDVMWLKPPPEKYLNTPVHVQCPEFEDKHYAGQALEKLVPENWKRPGEPWNMGVFGGTDTRTIRQYADEAISQFYKMAFAAESCSPHFACCVFEQFFLGEFMQAMRIGVTPLLPTLYQSDELARALGFRHFIAGSKRDPKYSAGIKKKVHGCCTWYSARIPEAMRILNQASPQESEP